jgi:hypothetical protein
VGDPKAKMQWKMYFQNIISRYRVVMEGWPSTIPIMNLSDTSSSQPQLEMLQYKWEMDLTYWKKLTDEEFQVLRQQRNTEIESGKIIEPTRRPHSDIGAK